MNKSRKFSALFRNIDIILRAILYIIQIQLKLFYDIFAVRDFFCLLKSRQLTSFWKGSFLPIVRCHEIFPEIIEKATLLYSPYTSAWKPYYPIGRMGSITPHHGIAAMSNFEVSILCGLVKVLKPSVFFEFGTQIGGCTYNIALNAPSQCQIYTLDLCPPSFPEKEIETCFRSGRIVQLIGDSIRYDFSPFFNRVDLLFIDASHDYLSKKSDSENALKMLTDTGTIVWHDYVKHYNGVLEYLKDLSKTQPLFHLSETTFAILTRSRKAQVTPWIEKHYSHLKVL